MVYAEPIGRREGSQILAWHSLGLSPRDIRELTEEAAYPYPARSTDGIRDYLKRRGRTPHRSEHGRVVRDPYCTSPRHPDEPIERRPNGDCNRCKTIVARERREAVRAGLAERVEMLRGMDGLAAEIADWIDENVRVA